MLLHGQVGAAFKKEQIFPHHVALGDAGVGVAEFEVDELVEVAGVAVVVDARLGMSDCVLGGFE